MTTAHVGGFNPVIYGTAHYTLQNTYDMKAGELDELTIFDTLKLGLKA